MAICSFEHSDPWPTAYVHLTYECGHRTHICTECFLLFRNLITVDRSLTLGCKYCPHQGEIGEATFD